MNDRLILLFTPPFDHSSLDPGYVKGYLPGIRENGGQYTHAAVWVMQAAALLGQGRLAFELLQILNPILHAQDPEGSSVTGSSRTSSRETCTASAPRRSRRLDMVHRLRELVLSGQSSSRSSVFTPWRSSDLSTVHSAGVVTVRDHVSFRFVDLYDQRGKPNGGRVRRCPVWLDNELQPENRFRWPTTTRHIKFALSSGNHDRKQFARVASRFHAEPARNAVKRESTCDNSAPRLRQWKACFGNACSQEHEQAREGK